MNIKDTFLKLTDRTYPYGYEEKLISFLPKGYKIDADGNYFYEIGHNNKTIFASHLDTACKDHTKVVHVIDGKYIRTDKKTVLGADDKAGVTVLLYMISQNVPGLYYFFIGEECGCIGSTAAAKRVDFFSKFDKIISFDRRATTSIITHQSSKRGCSDAFADSLSKEYKSHGLNLTKDDTGVYTDSAEFMKVIPECTNISVGYYREHTHDEHQDIEFLDKLAKASALVNWNDLKIERDPSKTEWKRYYGSYNNYNSYEWPKDQHHGVSKSKNSIDYRNTSGGKRRNLIRKEDWDKKKADEAYTNWVDNHKSESTMSRIGKKWESPNSTLDRLPMVEYVEYEDIFEDIEFNRHKTDFYKGVKPYFLNDELTKDDLRIIESQCLDMDNESDMEFLKYATNLAK